MLLPLLLLAAAPAPSPAPPTTPRALTEGENAEIGCIAVIGLIAFDQSRNLAPEWPPLQERGRTYAGIVGDRITFESGQPREVIAVAIKAAVDRHQAAAMAAADPAGYVRGALTPCLARLDAVVPPKP